MSYKVVAIGRQYGSGGHIIGELLSERLGCTYYDKNLIDIAAQKSGMNPGVLSEADEKAANPWLYATMVHAGQAGVNNVLSANDTLFYTQSEIISNIAQTQNAVIIGRCADYILKDEKVDLVSVFIYAPMEARIKRTMERDRLNKQQAVALIKRIDKQRKCYYEFYTDRKWSSHSNYDITLNSETFGINGCTDIIYNAISGK